MQIEIHPIVDPSGRFTLFLVTLPADSRRPPGFLGLVECEAPITTQLAPDIYFSGLRFEKARQALMDHGWTVFGSGYRPPSAGS